MAIVTEALRRPPSEREEYVRGACLLLRDASEGRLYIVDANKTDMGPPTALPLADKLHATRTLAKAFRVFVARPLEDG